MSKIFLFSPEKTESNKEDIFAAEKKAARLEAESWEKAIGEFQSCLANVKNDLQAPDGRNIVLASLHSKSTHRFESGLEISLVRNVDEFDRRKTMPVNGFVLQSETIPAGSEVIMHHNSVDPNNEIFNYLPLGGESRNVKYLSVPTEECYFYREPNTADWKPCRWFETALRVYVPYGGDIEKFIQKPIRLKNRLLVTSGKYKGFICVMVNGADYQSIFQGVDGREQQIIRFRTFDYENFDREEVIAIDHENTEKYNNGKLAVGLSADDCKVKEKELLLNTPLVVPKGYKKMVDKVLNEN
jgi:hypothetical protein